MRKQTPQWHISQVDRAGAAATLLTSVASALTCLGSFAVVMLDINYIAGCCSLLEDNCEVTRVGKRNQPRQKQCCLSSPRLMRLDAYPVLLRAPVVTK